MRQPTNKSLRQVNSPVVFAADSGRGRAQRWGNLIEINAHHRWRAFDYRCRAEAKTGEAGR
jgi:hypothetical protein